MKVFIVQKKKAKKITILYINYQVYQYYLVFNFISGDNKFKEIPTRAFQNLRNLEILEILNLPITHIRANAFNYLTKLEKLHIGDWPLQNIGTYLFIDNYSLT